jgi:hypothetical protein
MRTSQLRTYGKLGSARTTFWVVVVGGMVYTGADSINSTERYDDYHTPHSEGNVEA